MTIRELKDRVPYVKGIVKLPSPKGLREADIPIIADTDDSPETCLGEECRAVVYMNGLVLYTRGKYATVFRLHKCRETYGKGSVRLFSEVPYQFMFEQKKQADIAEILGIQRVTVATILRTALKTLRDRYPSF